MKEAFFFDKNSSILKLQTVQSLEEEQLAVDAHKKK